MDRNPRNAALAALCVLAVLFAAALFPATGFGDYPASAGGGGLPGGSGGSGGVTDERTSSGSDPTDSPTSTPTSESAGESTNPTENSEDSGSETTTTTTTEQPADTGPLDGGLLVTILAALLVLVGGGLVVGFRLGILAVEETAGAIPLTVSGTPLGELLGRVPEATMRLVVGVSGSLPRLLDDAGDLLSGVGRGGAAAADGLGTALAGTAGALGRGLTGTLAAIGGVLGSLLSAPGLLSRPSSGSLFGSSDSGGAAAASTGASERPPEDSGPPSVEEAWEEMTDEVYVRNDRAATPAEYARAAVERGFPADAVARLTDAFREVRYGQFPAGGERTDAARDALSRIRDYLQGDVEGDG